MARWTFGDERTETSHLSPTQKQVTQAVWGTEAEFKAEVDEKLRAEIAARPHILVAKYRRRRSKT